jgi:hypothetical protein
VCVFGVSVGPAAASLVTRIFVFDTNNFRLSLLVLPASRAQAHSGSLQDLNGVHNEG